MFYNDNNRYGELQLMVSWNQGSNWDNHGYATASISPNTSDNYVQCASCMSTVNATANARLRFNLSQHNNSAVTYGETTAQATGFTILRIVDNV